MKTKLIGLTGYKGSGKDTVGEILCTDFNFERFAFADKLRQVCREVYGIEMKYFTDTILKEQTLEKFGMSPREILIHVGQSMREINPNVWCDFAMNVIDQIEEFVDTLWNGDRESDGYVITDVRHYNELEAILERGGVVVRVVREGCELGNDLPHTGFPDRDLIEIYNDGTIEDLKEKIKFLVDSLDYPEEVINGNH